MNLKYRCNVCDFKNKHHNLLKKHLVSNHTKEDLINAGYEELFIKKAIEYEINRLTQMMEKGEKIIQQTRSFDADQDTTFAIRDKEDANDYRYFPDPDLAPFHLTDDFIQDIASALPSLPNRLPASLS